MKRYEEERKIMQRRYSENKNFKGGYTNKKAGHFRKRHFLDCGNSRCHVCHSDKFPIREITTQEKLAELELEEYRGEFP